MSRSLFHTSTQTKPSGLCPTVLSPAGSDLYTSSASHQASDKMQALELDLETRFARRTAGMRIESGRSSNNGGTLRKVRWSNLHIRHFD